MKKASNSATSGNQSGPVKRVRPGALKNHDHLHALNCGHKSYVHGNHVDYECNGHYHFVEEGNTYDCPGPNAKILPFPKK